MQWAEPNDAQPFFIISSAKMVINEEAGVPNGLYELACAISQDIAYFNELTEDEISELVEYEGEIQRSVEFGGGTVVYNVFYDENYLNKGNADSESISFNVVSLVKAMSNDDYDGIDNACDELITVILHELTHLYAQQQGEGNGSDEHIWLKYSGKLDSDVREFIYCLSSSEINARVASSVSIFDRYQVKYGGNFQSAMVRTLNDHELRFYALDYMMMKLREELRYAESNDGYFNVRFKPTYYGYSLAANDSRLFGGGVKKANELCSKDYASVLRHELSFYGKLIEAYRKKIYKACWTFANRYNIKN